jgi:heme-degrading monooxygenase HmoA
MSVIVMTKLPGPAVNLEQLAAGEHNGTMQRISEEARTKGALHHLFVEDTDGNILVIDEWETAEAFEAFFAGQSEIRQLAADVGVTGPPTSTVYRILDTPDRT